MCVEDGFSQIQSHISKNFEFKKEVGITIKSKKTSSYSYLCSSNQLGILSYITIIHQPVTVSSSMRMQPNTCANEVFPSTFTRFNPYFRWCCHLYVLYQPKYGFNLLDVLENASFAHVFGCMCMLELTVTGWWIIVT